MIVHRFMSDAEFISLISGAKLRNTTDHAKERGLKTTSVGFCFFTESPDEAIHWLSGICEPDWCVTMDFPDHLLKESMGTYRDVKFNRMMKTSSLYANNQDLQGDGNFVDLGLPSGLLWAKCNLGAKKETDYGLYFAWGETEGHADASGTKKFSWNDYKSGTQYGLTKYNATDGLTTLQAEDDAVTQMYGEGYRIPTKEELVELQKNTDNEWTSIDGVSGCKFMKKSDHSVYIFIPASGNCGYGSRNGVGNCCGLWSSSVYSSGRNSAWDLYSDSGGIFMYGNYRCYGQSVRGVGAKVQNCSQVNFSTLDAGEVSTIQNREYCCTTYSTAEVKLISVTSQYKKYADLFRLLKNIGLI